MNMNHFNEFLSLFTLSLIMGSLFNLTGILGIIILFFFWYITGENEYYKGYQDGLNRKHEK